MSGDKRRQARLSIALPVRVQGYEAGGGTWEEMTKCQDASAGGAGLMLQRSVKVGQVLLLFLPLPRQFRAHDLSAPTYRTYALVQTAKAEESGCRIGVAFIGKNPPPGFDKNPAGRFLKERRTARRSDVQMKVRLLHQRAAGASAAEPGVIENYSAGGARARTSLEIREGEIIQVEEMEGAFRARAEVCAVSQGPDGVLRISLKFL